MRLHFTPYPAVQFSGSTSDALTRIAGRYDNAGDRLVVDQKAAGLLSLAA